MNAKVLCAIFKRNFVAYFSNPTGYVFICLFVLFSSLAAFWPHEFFASNLANLDQLHFYFPVLMLFFAPAITMGVWADELRQGTDELVLTLPAHDLDVVLGKYLAVIAIYFVSLLFSFVSNVVLLSWMGSPDLGLLMANYFGYFFVGLAMLAIGMIASFLTGNVTVSLVIGVLLNGPLVIVGFAMPEYSRLGIADRFADFGRGIVSFSSIAYFGFVAIAALYICMVLIGRRHWMGGRDGKSMLGHFIIRAVAIIVGCVGMIYFLGDHDIRPDATFAQLNSLAPETGKLLSTLNKKPLEDLAKRREKLDQQIKDQQGQAAGDELAKLKQRLAQLDLEQFRLKSPVEVEAFLSKDVSDRYAAKRLDLISKLQEMKSLAGGKLKVTIHEIEPFSELAEQAKEQYGIEPRTVGMEIRGVSSEENVFLGAVVRSGLKQDVIPFFELGIPVEYELIRSICTVSESDRKTLGVVKTDVNLVGGFDMTRGRMIPTQPIIEELRKQYKVVDVDPSMPIVDPNDPEKEKYDVLLVAQPSSLPSAAIFHLKQAIESGIPTAIFEDPYPFPPFYGSAVPGTDAPRRAPRSPMMMMGRPPQAPPKKGKIVQQLFRPLGIELVRKMPKNVGFGRAGKNKEETAVIWQDFNPYPQLRFTSIVNDAWIFANNGAGTDGFTAFDAKDEISSRMYELLFIYPGGIVESNMKPSTLTVTPLVRTSRSGYVLPSKVRSAESPNELRKHQKTTDKEYTLAARIKGTIERNIPVELPVGQTPDPLHPPLTKSVTQEINVVVVSDIDMLHGAFFSMRANPQQTGIKLQFQNVPFILNMIDSLACSEEKPPRFIEIRKQRQLHGRLTKFQKNLQEKVLSKMKDAIDEAQDNFEKETKNAEDEKKKRKDEAQGKFDKMRDAGNTTASALLAIQYEYNQSTKNSAESRGA